MADKRMWAVLTVEFPDHPKIEVLSDAAFRVLIEMILWSRKHLTDGVVPAGVVAKRWAKTQTETDALTQSVTQLLTELPTQNKTPLRELLMNDCQNPSLSQNNNGDFIIHDFLEHQQSKADYTARKARNTANGRKGGRPRKTQPVTESDTQPVTESGSESGSETKPTTKALLTTNYIDVFPPNGEKTYMCEPDENSEIEAPDEPKRKPYPDDFEEFWAAYPRRTGKREAYRAWKDALKRETADVITAGAKRYAEDPNRVDAYTKHPAPWLRADRWADDPLPAYAAHPAGKAAGGTDARVSEWFTVVPGGKDSEPEPQLALIDAPKSFHGGEVPF